MRYIALIVLLTACNESTGTEGVEVANECVQQELGMICPLGTAPKLVANAMSSCNQATDFSAEYSMLTMAGGGTLNKDSVCVGMGDCLIECTIVIQCDEYESFTAEEIKCK